MLQEFLNRTPGVHLTSATLTHVIRTVDIDTVQQLFNDYGPEVFTGDVICRSILLSGFYPEKLLVLEPILQRTGAVSVTADNVVFAIRSSRDGAVVKMLLDYGWTLVEQAVTELVRWTTPAAFEVLLDRGTPITRETLIAAAGNIHHGDQMIKLQLSRLGRPIKDDEWLEMM